jgi:hypothetical protein
MKPKVRKLWNEVKQRWHERVSFKDLYANFKDIPKEIKYLACYAKRRVREAVSKINPWHENSYKELQKFDEEINDCVEIVNRIAKIYECEKEFVNRAAHGRICDGLFHARSSVHSDYINNLNNKNFRAMNKTIKAYQILS